MLADQPDTRVRLSYRRDRLARVKPANLQRFHEAVRGAAIQPLWTSEVRRITSSTITYADAAAAEHTLENDDVFVYIGGELPTKFLQDTGIALDTKFGEP